MNSEKIYLTADQVEDIGRALDEINIYLDEIPETIIKSGNNMVLCGFNIRGRVDDIYRAATVITDIIERSKKSNKIA